MPISSASHARTNDKIFELLRPWVRSDAKIFDFGAGRGHMCERLGNYAQQQGIEPSDCVIASEVVPECFEYEPIECRKIGINSEIPMDDDSLDVVYAIEVLEHCRRPYDFFDQAFRVLKPGGMVLFSVPNIMHLTSRLQNLFQGYGEMFDAPSKLEENAGRICGHIMPLNFAWFHYGLTVSGFEQIKSHADRRKRGAMFLSAVMSPALLAGSVMRDIKVRRYDKDVWKENRSLIYKMNSIDTLTSRSCIVQAYKPTTESSTRRAA